MTMLPVIIASLSSFLVLMSAYGVRIIRREGAEKYVEVTDGSDVDSPK